jgi:tRNA-2-methylthio-N6-dimethylallyladenosine synthase
MNGSARDGRVKVFIETYGCQMNSYDTTVMYGIVEEHGYARAETPDEADVVLLNTCSVRDLAEHKIHSRVGELRSLNRRGLSKAAIMGVTGCMAERMSTDLVKGERPADLVLGVDQYAKLPEMLDRAVARAHGEADHASRFSNVAVGHQADVHYVAPPDAYPTNNSHLVTIHKGCDYKCTYCIVPATRGPQREKAPEVIEREIRDIVAAGGREVTLLGQNVTAYRAPDLDFAGLLRLIDPIEGLERVRFLTGHPCDMNEELVRTMSELDKICPWLHVPAQSGSDRVLRRMKRHYTSDRYLELVETARRWLPEVTFSGDFIVGFPGETDEDFRMTLELVRKVRYDQTFNFKYSERPATPAAKLDDDVPLEVKKERLAELMAVQEEVWSSMASAATGEIWDVAVEEEARRPAGSWRARSLHNRKVLLQDHDGFVGQTLKVRVTGCEATTFHGEPV